MSGKTIINYNVFQEIYFPKVFPEFEKFHQNSLSFPWVPVFPGLSEPWLLRGEIKCCYYYLWYRLSLVYIWNIKKLKNNEKFEKKMSNITKKTMMMRKAVEPKRMKRVMLSQNVYHEFHLSSNNVEEDRYIIQQQYTMCDGKKQLAIIIFSLEYLIFLY